MYISSRFEGAKVRKINHPTKYFFLFLLFRLVFRYFAFQKYHYLVASIPLFGNNATIVWYYEYQGLVL